MFIVVKFKNKILFTLSLVLCAAIISYSAIYIIQNVDFIHTFRPGEEEEEQVSDPIKLPIIMYHSVLKSKSSKFIITPTQFENDLKYLQENKFNTVTMNDLIDYVNNNKPLPEKPIIITFDDGCLNNYTYAVPLLEKYKMKAVFSVVGRYIEDYSKVEDHNPSYSYFNWDDIKKLIASDAVEFQCHSYNMHKNNGKRNGASRYKGESLEAYEKILTEDITKFKEIMKENAGYETTTFTYPFGAYSESSENIIKKEGFLASLTCRERLNYITKDNASLYALGRFNRSGTISTEDFFRKVLKNYD